MRGKRAKMLRKEAAEYRSFLYLRERIPLTKKGSEKIVKNGYRLLKEVVRKLIPVKERKKKPFTPSVERVVPEEFGPEVLEQLEKEEVGGWDE